MTSTKMPETAVTDTGTHCEVCDDHVDSAYLCNKHYRELRTWITDDLPRLWYELDVVASRMTKTYKSSYRQRSHSAEVDRWEQERSDIPAALRSSEPAIALPATASMYNQAVVDLKWAIGNTLGRWAQRITFLTNEPMPKGAEAFSWLADRLEHIRTSDTAGDMYTQVRKIRDHAERVVDRSPERTYYGLCHTTQPDNIICEQPLYGRHDTDTLTCDSYYNGKRGCGAEHSRTERKERLVNDALLPIATWQDVLPKYATELEWPHPSTWGRWVTRRQITPKGVNEHGVDVYSGSDIIDLCRREQRRIIGNRNKYRTPQAA